MHMAAGNVINIEQHRTCTGPEGMEIYGILFDSCM